MIHRLLHNTLTVINLVLALSMLVCYASSYINPSDFWIPAFVGLAYPFLLALNILFLIYWSCRRKIEFTISLAVILLGINHITAFVQLPFGNKPSHKKADIKLLTYNVNMFHLYKWSKEKPSYNEIISFVNDNSINVACFQEFFVDNSKFSENNARKLLDMNIHSKYVVSNKQTQYGIATFSKFPIVATGEVKLKDTYNACIYTDIKINNDTIRVYNVHLQSTRFKERNLRFLLNYGKQKYKNTYEEVWDIVSRLRNAFEKRGNQVDCLANHAANCHYTTIICGDFNDSPLSYAYHKLSKNRKDSFIEAGIGFINTYRKFWPSYRIDYILHSKTIKATHYSCPRINYSDHYPVVTEFTTE